MFKAIKYYLGFGYQPKCGDEVKVSSGFYRGAEAIVFKEALIGDEVWVMFHNGREELIYPWHLELK